MEEEENSLYKFKDRDRLLETDEEREERTFREHFPDYYESYEDILQKDNEAEEVGAEGVCENERERERERERENGGGGEMVRRK